MVSVGLGVDLEDNSVSGLDLLEDFVGVDWLDENRVVIEGLFLVLSEFGSDRFDDDRFGGNFQSMAS